MEGIMDQKKKVVAKYKVERGEWNMWWFHQIGSCGVYKVSVSVYFVSEDRTLDHFLYSS
jgi:hypothetical protein